MFSDSLLAFKTTFVSGFGMYGLIFAQLMIGDGRPFWDQTNVNSNGQCLYSYSSPNTRAFNMTFMFPYIIVIYLYKYNAKPNIFVNTICIVSLLMMWVWIYVESYVNGTAYIYQNVCGQFCGFIYLVLVLTFDDEIHKYCEKVGFIVKSSRSRKFTVFFSCLACFIFIIAYFSAESDRRMPIYWIVNSVINEEACQSESENRASNNLGLNASFNNSSILFMLIGANFGQSLTLNFVKPLHWSHTPLWKRLLRSVIGLILAIAFFKACSLLVT